MLTQSLVIGQNTVESLGSLGPEVLIHLERFFRAEIYANEAGRKLAKDISILLENNIQVNIITHSLGARVALAALNILGDANQLKR